jgi:four helix bundle protein
MSQDCALAEKKRFLEITRMLIGLRKAWLQNTLSEEAQPYQPDTSRAAALFHHESLDMYKVGLAFMRWFINVPGVSELPDRLCREIDKTATSAVLNVAEGNGRYSELDHRRFLEVAAASAVKAAAYLDLYQQKVLPTRFDTTEGQDYLARMVAMLSRF